MMKKKNQMFFTYNSAVNTLNRRKPLSRSNLFKSNSSAAMEIV